MLRLQVCLISKVGESCGGRGKDNIGVELHPQPFLMEKKAAKDGILIKRGEFRSLINACRGTLRT